jgi:sialate O-acetylesterase
MFKQNLLLLSAVLLASKGYGVTLPKVFSDHMVLQQGSPVIYGWGEQGEAIKVSIAGKAGKAKAAENGFWSVKISGLKPGGPHTLVVEGNNRVEVKDVLVGEVWLCSGQSNMEWANAWFSGRHLNLGNTSNPKLRLLHTPNKATEEPRRDQEATWEVANDAAVQNFSVIGFLFAQRLQSELGVPVGIIQAAWGGTPAESWTTWRTLEADPMTKPITDRFLTVMKDFPAANARYQKALADWNSQNEPVDPGNKGEGLGWANGEPDSTWGAMDLPGYFGKVDGADYDGVTWVAHDLWLSSSFLDKDLILELGPIDDYDTTYFNGIKVGATGPETANSYAQPRKYVVPKSLLRAGKNVLAVRVVDGMGVGGFSALPQAFRAVGAGGEVSLAGSWRVKIEHKAKVMSTPAPQPPMGWDNPWAPSSLYNGMIAPLTPFTIRGAIWYQGESNADRSVQYLPLFKNMILDWRKSFENPKMPFYFVQLANFMAEMKGPEEGGWPELREAQRQTLALPNTGMALAIDAGEANDIHPFRKDVVADRLARIALARDYKKEIAYLGPTVEKVRIDGNLVRILLKNAAGLKTSDGGAPTSCVVAGKDGKWVMADARIEGNSLVIWHRNVLAPVAARYAWANNPKANVVNGEGLPLGPFRTDDWPLTTEKNR